MTAPCPALIAHVIHRLDYGGLENGLVNLINGLPAERFRHHVICLAGFSDFRARITREDVVVESLDKQEGKDPGAYLRLWHMFRRLRPDLVHTRNFGTVDLQWVAAAAGVRRRVHGEHGWVAGDARGQDPHTLRIRRACRPAIQRYVAMSRDIAQWLERDVGVPSRRIRQIYNGVDSTRFQPEGPRPADLPWSTDPGCVTFGTVGRLDPIKNQAALLEAFSGILDRNPGWRGRFRLIIAGDGPLRPALAERAARLAVQGDVWFPGARTDVADVVRAMDVFVLTSINEGISNTILEAMACGRPVVACNVGGNPELVEHEATGLLYEAGEGSGGLEAAMTRYAATPELREAHGAAARRRVLERFSLPAMLAQYAAFYDEALAGGRSPARH